MSFAIFYKPSDLALLGLTSDTPAPTKYACVETPDEPADGLDPVKTVVQLPNGWFKICDPTMVMVIIDEPLSDYLERLGESHPLYKDLKNNAVEPWPVLADHS